MGTALVTGGAGYLGTHTCVALLEAGWEVVVVDDLSNSTATGLARVRELVPQGSLELLVGDIRDERALDEAFAGRAVDAVVHFAGLKAVGESVAEPLRYWDVNVGGTVTLLRAMERAGVRDLVFSSSCTVYGEPETVPLTEGIPLRDSSSPYGRTKLAVERVLEDLAGSDPRWRIIPLRYFNPVGAHPSGRIGEDPRGTPNNLMPFVMQVAVGRREQVTVHGDDYPTRDGTCIRDYIHVVDLAEAHLAALAALPRIEGCHPINVGTGTGHTVLEVLDAAGEAAGHPIPRTVGPRRPGDASEAWADTTHAEEVLGWRATRTLAEMCQDHHRWQQANPNGYADA